LSPLQAQVERVLGLDGQAPAAGGLYLPETLVQPGAAIARFKQFGVRITTEREDQIADQRISAAGASM
jgi:hypothetical protein